MISHLKSTKNVWKWTKKGDICLLLKAGWHVKAGRLPDGVPWICLLSVDFVTKKQVLVWLAFGCAQHPKAGQNTQQLTDAEGCSASRPSRSF